jgi:hypothetical protein
MNACDVSQSKDKMHILSTSMGTIQYLGARLISP